MNARALSWHLNINILSIRAQYWGRQGKVLDKVSSEDNTAGIHTTQVDLAQDPMPQTKIQEWKKGLH